VLVGGGNASFVLVGGGTGGVGGRGQSSLFQLWSADVCFALCTQSGECRDVESRFLRQKQQVASPVQLEE